MSKITIKKEISSDMKINSCNSKAKEIHCDIVKGGMKINCCKPEAKEIHSGIVKKEMKINNCNSEAREIDSNIVKKEMKISSRNLEAKEFHYDIVKKKRKINSKAKDIVKKEMKISRCNKEIYSDIMKKEMKIDSCDTEAKEIHSDIVFEVLTRVPIKDLDRFKPVNRILNSSKGLFYASMHGKNETFAHRLRLPYLYYEDITPVVNGLACVYTGHEVSLFNISTRELMELPPSSLRGEGKSVWYALGVDPTDNVYKLLKVCTITNQLVYEILTLETSSRSSWRWREIVQEGFPCFSSVRVQSYFLNGMIYCKFRTARCFRVPGVEYLVAFDVHQERFTIFNLPVFGQFEGHLAVARVKKTQFETVLEVWALEDHLNSFWSKHKIDMPDELVRDLFRVTPIGNLASGELLLCGLDCNRLVVSFYIYDPTNKKYRKLMVELPRSLRVESKSLSAHITCLSEKITPLDDLVGLRKK